MWRKRVLAGGLSLLALGVALAGCGSATTASSAAGNGAAAASGTSSSTSSAKRAASQGSSASGTKTLVLYEAEGYAPAVAAAFQKATGIQTKVVHLPTGKLVAKIEAERSNPEWDVFWFDGASSARALANQGLTLTGYTPGDIKNYSTVGQRLLPTDHAYFPTGVTVAAVIGYNTKYVTAAEAPKDWADLLKPQFKGKVAMNDPSISGPTYPFVAGILQTMGKTAGEQYFEKLKKAGLQVYPKNKPTIAATLQGTAWICLVQNTALLNAIDKKEPLKLVNPASGDFTLPGALAIAKNAKDMGPAKQFVDYVLSPAGQAVMTQNGGADSYFDPIVKGVTPNVHAILPNSLNWVYVDPIKAAKQESSVLQWFSDNIVH